jgi:outer membrane protein assembly factor BamA
MRGNGASGVTQRRQRRRWPRRLALAAAVLALLPLLAAGAALLALRSAGARRALLVRVERVLREATGVSATAADFRADLRHGVLDLERIAAAVPGRPPFLTADRLRVEVDLASLRSPVIVVRAVEVERPRLDLAAALPQAPADDGAAAAPARRVDVLAARVRGGEVVHGIVPAQATPWLTAWSLAAIDADGAYVDGRASAAVTIGTIALERPGRERREARLELAGAGRPGGEFAIERLHLTAAGLDLEASASGTASAAGPLTAPLHLAAEPALLAPELGTGGTVSATATVRLPERTVEAHVEAVGLAVAALRPYLGDETLALAAAAGTTVDVTADLGGPIADPDRIAGTAHLVWYAGDEHRLDATATLDPRPESEHPVRVAFAAALLPDLPGVRRVDGAATAATLQGLARGTLEPTTLTLDVPDLAAAYGDLRARWPLLVPELGVTEAMGRAPGATGSFVAPADAGAPQDDSPLGPGTQALRAAGNRSTPAWLIGALRATATASGTFAAPHATLDATWTPEAGSAVTVTARGEPLARRGEAAVVADGLRLGLLRPDLGGTVSATVHASGSPASYRATLTLDGDSLAAGPDMPVLDALHVEAVTDGARVTVSSLSGAVGEARFAGAAEAALALPLADARLDLRLTRPLPRIDSADVALRLAAGVLHIEVPGVDTAAGIAALSAAVPLGALRAAPALADALADTPLVTADGPIRLSVDAPALDSWTLLPLLGLPERRERVRAGLRADLLLDPDDLTAAIGEFSLANLRADLEGRAVTTTAPVRLELADRRLRLLPVEIATADVTAGIEGEATLAAAFRPGEDDPATLVERFSADIAGAVDTVLLRPYLAGGIAEGEVRFDIHAAGTPAAPIASFALYGPEASFFWPVPYATRLSALDVAGEYRDGEAVLRTGRAALNGGVLSFAGRRGADGGLAARLTLGDVRYRLDFGASAVLDGDLRLALPAAGRGELTGEVVVRRALLARDIDLDRELLRRFFSPVTTTGTETGLLDTIDLDVALSTVDGVKVKNNVADLALSWEPLAIGGTAWNPTIKGRVDVRPGGLVFAYGQTVRVDSGVFTFTGNPLTDPLIEVETTSSLTDPSIARLGAERSPLAALAGEDGEGDGDAAEALAAGVAGYFGERLASRFTESLGLGSVSLRPLLIFGEADPGARLTLTRDLSANVALAFSLDLRNAQRQTYLLDLHGFHAAPSLSAQVFTTDDGTYGMTLQQTLELGGPPRDEAAGPLVQRVRATPPTGVGKRALRAAIGVGKGDVLPDGAEFDIEVEVATLLRECGYPDADVRVEVSPSPERPERVDVAVAIDPGPRARFVFAGEKIAKGSRPLVTSLYRTDYYEAAAIEEMRRTAVRVLRAQGFLDPVVAISVERADDADPRSDRIVTVATAGGRRLELAAPRFTGLADEDAALVAARFPTALERAELAAGMRDADARVVESLRVLGYPGGRIAGRTLDEDAGVLTVALDPGARTLIGSVAISGLAPADEVRLAAALPLAAGDPARADRIALAALAIEQDLRRRGFADAAVRPRVSADPALPAAVAVRLEADPGAAYRVGDVSFDALRFTRRSLAARTAALDPGGVFRPDEVAAARSRLARLGVFSSVGVDTVRAPDGTVGVTFRTAEQPRFAFSYGVRWESEQGVSAVVEAVDRNLLGRAVTLGARALYERDDASGRLYVGASDLLGTRAGFDAFLERRRRTSGNLQSDTIESTFGLRHPAGRSATARVYAAYHDTRLTEVEPDPFFPLDVTITHPYLGAQLVLDTRSDPLRGGAGVFASADLSGSGPFLGSDFEYARLFAQLNWYLPVRLGPLGATWAQSVRVGLAKPYAGQELIPDVRFFAGGAYSVRGYADETLGPTETLGDLTRAVGGEALLVLNEELRVRLPWDLVGLAFVDVGNVWATPSDFGRDLVTALGLGLRADTPVGLLRLDAAFPLDAPAGEPGFKLYFGFGNAF